MSPRKTIVVPEGNEEEKEVFFFLTRGVVVVMETGKKETIHSFKKYLLSFYHINIYLACARTYAKFWGKSSKQDRHRPLLSLRG